MVQIPPEQVRKLKEIDKIRPDLTGYAISKKVHALLQEKLADVFKSKSFFPHQDGITKGKWFEYIRDLLPVHISSPISIGIVRHSQEMIGCPFTRILVANDNEKTWWGNYKEDIYNIGEYLIDKLKDKKFASIYYDRYKRLYLDIIKSSEKIKNTDLSKFSKQELLEKYTEFYEKFKHFHALTFDIDAIDICLDKKIREKLQQLIKDKNIFNENYTLVTSPDELSYTNKEQLEIYELVKTISKNKEVLQIFDYDVNIIFTKLEKHPELDNKLNELVKEYWWTSLGWIDRTEKDKKSFVMEIKAVLKSDKNINEEIKRLKSFEKQTRENKKILAQELKFDSEIGYYLDVFKHYALFHDWRKEGQMKGTAVMNSFLFEIGSRYGSSYNDLSWAWPWEIQNYIQTEKIDLVLLRKRKEALFILVTQEGIEQHTGEDAIRRRKEELEADIKEIQDFKGVIASIGKVTGTVKVCFSAAEAKRKIKQGDILVTSMTLPDYVPAMRKAAAIVTDEGGVTCHAAIISRELGIPCLVGTRIATRALKDGNLVEVNANHGIVKIMK